MIDNISDPTQPDPRQQLTTRSKYFTHEQPYGPVVPEESSRKTKRIIQLEHEYNKCIDPSKRANILRIIAGIEFPRGSRADTASTITLEHHPEFVCPSCGWGAAASGDPSVSVAAPPADEEGQ